MFGVLDYPSFFLDTFFLRFEDTFKTQNSQDQSILSGVFRTLANI